MLNVLRNHAQSWVIKVLLGLIVVTFVVSFGVGSFQHSKVVVAKVGGEEILINDFRKQYDLQMQNLRQRFPDRADVFARQMNLRKQVLENMVNRALLVQAASQRGLLVSDGELEETIKTIPAFQQKNQFDYKTYTEMLKKNGLNPDTFEKLVREDLMVQKLQRNLAQGVVVSQAEVEERYRLSSEKAEVAYVFLDPERFKGKVAVSEADERAYYDSHKSAYQHPAQVNVEYFTLSLADVSLAVDLPEKVLLAYYERNKEQRYTGKPQVRASHILKRLAPNAPPEEAQKVRTQMIAILNEVKSGKDFAQLAKKYSEDATKDKGGDLGFFGKGEMVPAFEQAAFALKAGQISDIVTSPFGLHIIKVTGVKPSQGRSFEEVREEIRREVAAQRAEAKLQTDAERLAKDMEQKGLTAVAAEYKVKVQKTGLFSREQVVGGLGSAQLLFDMTQSDKKFDVWKRNPIMGHVFYHVLEKKPALPMTFEEARPEVHKQVLAAKAQEQAVQVGKKALESKAALSAVASAHGLKVTKVTLGAMDAMVPNLGRDTEFQHTALTLSADKPLGMSSFMGKTYLIHLEGRRVEKNANPEVTKQQLRASLQAEAERFFQMKEMERMRKDIKVEIMDQGKLEAQ